MRVSYGSTSRNAAPEAGPAARARTGRLMLETAIRLMQSGATPSVSEVAEAAGVSRATAYRYFPSQAALVRAVVDEALGPILTWTSQVERSGAPRHRTDRHGPAAHRRVRGDLQGGAEAVAGAVGAAAGPARSARSRVQARAPDRSAQGRARAAEGKIASQASSTDLAQALSLVFGLEVLIVLKDIWGLDGRGNAICGSMGGQRARSCRSGRGQLQR